MLSWAVFGVSGAVSFVGLILLALVSVAIGAMYGVILAVDAVRGAVTSVGLSLQVLGSAMFICLCKLSVN